MRHLATAVMAVLILAACTAGTASAPPSVATPSVATPSQFPPSPAPSSGASPSTDPTSPPPAAVPDTDDLAGREFWSTAVQGMVLVPDTRVVLIFFDDGTLDASAGCNYMGGRWALDGATLKMEIATTTEIGCGADKQAQDESVTKWLSADPSAAIDGDQLILTGRGVTMTLLDREIADPDQPLEGTTWVLDGLIYGSIPEATVSSVPVGVRPGTLRLEGDRLTVDTGCNTGDAAATVDGDTLTIDDLALTDRACEGYAAEVEATMASVLQGDLQVMIQGRRLNLIGPDGGLMFLAEGRASTP
jgi:heat shock protein HslJ